MDIAKSILGVRDHQGYVGKEEHSVRPTIARHMEKYEPTQFLQRLGTKLESQGSDENELCEGAETLAISSSSGVRPCPGGPFSAIIPSMWYETW